MRCRYVWNAYVFRLYIQKWTQTCVPLLVESAPVETMMKFNLELTEATAYALVHFRLNHVTEVDGCSDNISVRILWDI